MMNRDSLAAPGRLLALLLLAAGPALPRATADPPTPAERAHWSFRVLHRPAVPSVRSPNGRTPIDAFLLTRLQSKGLTFAPEASRASLLRRVHLDLLGLPPSPEEVRRFLADDRPDAYERVVERLLASPHFGERWGRHWLDAAGYVDVGGTDNDAGIIRLAEGSWRYRDYVIRSVNEDKPLDRFLLEQLAGDELLDWRSARQRTPAMRELLVATGFLRTAADDTEENELNTPDIRHGVLQRTVEVMASNLLGVTLSCAKCHDHKYEPISQTDYYRLVAVFAPALNPEKWLQPKQRLLSDLAAVEKAAQEKTNAAIDRQVAELQKQRKELKQQPRADPQKLAELDSKIQELGKQKRSVQPLRALYDTGPPTATRLLRRGDPTKVGKEVQPGGLTVLCPPEQTDLPTAQPSGATSGRRLALARWLTQPGTPASALVARTQVNRVWQHLFGRGLVATCDNLGMSGSRPTHPELLEWLASEFVAQHWQLKPLLRTILTSTVYRQTSAASGNAQVDPANELLGRMPLRRLEAEIIRDSILAISGKLATRMGGPPVPLTNRPDGLVIVNEEGKHRRSIYVLARRNYHPTLLNVFDQPFMTTNTLCRSPSAVVLQSLTMLHDTFILEQAGFFAERVQRVGSTPETQVEAAFLLAFARAPNPQEHRDCVAFLRSHALRELCHVLLNTNELLYTP